MRERLRCLDVFRGATIAGMILVNNPGTWSHVYAPLRHAEWHGCTPTDLVFPFFVFIVGVAVVLSKPGILRIGRRTAVLFGLGLFLAAFPIVALSESFKPPDHPLRIAGVLQRIAVCYAVAAWLVPRSSTIKIGVVIAVCLLAYWAAMVLIPVPEVGAGMVDDKAGNLAAWIDRQVLGEHIWRGGKVYDPEGILSTVPAIATCLLGALAGRALTAELPELKRRDILLGAGAALIGAGLAWDQLFPINKPLWTSSYVLYTAGWASCALGTCYWTFDIGKQKWGLPFEIFGRNAILVFVGSGVLARTLSLLGWKQPIYETLFASWLEPVNASLAYALTWVLAWFLVLAWLYRRGWFLRV